MKHLWRDLKMADHRCSPSNLTVPETICHQEWDKLSISRRTMLVSKKTSSCNKFLKKYISVFHFDNILISKHVFTLPLWLIKQIYNTNCTIRKGVWKRPLSHYSTYAQYQSKLLSQLLIHRYLIFFLLFSMLQNNTEDINHEIQWHVWN